MIKEKLGGAILILLPVKRILYFLPSSVLCVLYRFNKGGNVLKHPNMSKKLLIKLLLSIYDVRRKFTIRKA